jgi:AraC family transcriptional regulator
MTEQVIRMVARTPLFCVSDAQCAAHRHPWGVTEGSSATQLVLVRRGLFGLQFGRRSFLADANHAVLFNRGDDYRVNHPTSLGDDCTILVPSMALMEEAAPNDARCLLVPSAALRLHAQLCSCVAHPGTATLEVEERALALMQCVLNLRSGRAPRRARNPQVRARRSRWIGNARELLSAEPGANWTLQEVARHVGCAPAHLTTVFRLETGMPMHRYLRRLRLALAMAEMVKRTRPITEIALALGFATPSHFSTCFKAEFGCSPRRAILSTWANHD